VSIRPDLGSYRRIEWYEPATEVGLARRTEIATDNAEDFKAGVAAVGSPTNAKKVSGRNGGLKIDWAKPP
jgi:hypothetical protein